MGSYFLIVMPKQNISGNQIAITTSPIDASTVVSATTTKRVADFKTIQLFDNKGATTTIMHFFLSYHKKVVEEKTYILLI